MAKPQEDRYLYRLQGKKGTGWQVRMPARILGEPLTHFFADQLFGGDSAAKQRAARMRDRLLERANKPLHVSGYLAGQASRRYAGMPAGLTLRPIPRPSGPPRWHWAVYWFEDGQQRKKEFSVQRWGLLGGLQRAVAIRHEKTGLLLGEDEVSKTLALAQQALAHP